MQNMPDEEIDELFRKAAQFEPDYEPHFWDSMQEKLDNALAEEFVRRKLLWLTLAEGLFIILICLLFIIPIGGKTENLQSNVTEVGVDSNTTTTTQSSENRINKAEKNGFQTDATREHNQEDLKKSNPIINSGKENFDVDNQNTSKPQLLKIEKSKPEFSENNVEKDRQKTEKDKTLKTVQTSKEKLINGGVLNKPLIKDTLQKPTYYPKKQSSIIQENSVIKEEKVLSRQLVVLKPILSRFPKIRQDSLKKIETASIVIYKDTTAAKPLHHKPERLLSHFSIGLAVAPDLSSIGFRNLKSPGKNGGILISYSLSPRWSITSGFIYAKKIYSALPEDYHSGWAWLQQVNVTDINVNCTVLDIPLNVQYKFLLRPRHSFYLGTGISSYFMEEEDYSYKYIQNNQPKTRDWYFNNENEHLLGVANFALGYEKILTRRWSLQTEAFFKQPLTDIGVAQVRLNSMGLFFIARYRFP
jgi:hypothetical protein